MKKIKIKKQNIAFNFKVSFTLIIFLILTGTLVIFLTTPKTNASTLEAGVSIVSYEVFPSGLITDSDTIWVSVTINGEIGPSSIDPGDYAFPKLVVEENGYITGRYSMTASSYTQVITIWRVNLGTKPAGYIANCYINVWDWNMALVAVSSTFTITVTDDPLTEDTTAPEIAGWISVPSSPTMDIPFLIVADVEDVGIPTTGVDTVSIHYKINDGTLNIESMHFTSGTNYEKEFLFTEHTELTFYFVAIDKAGNEATSRTYVLDIEGPEPTTDTTTTDTTDTTTTDTTDTTSPVNLPTKQTLFGSFGTIVFVAIVIGGILIYRRRKKLV